MTGMKRILWSILLAGILGTAQADEVKDAIKEGLKLYEAGDTSGAAAQLDYAATLLRQAKGQALTQVFPEPLKGWQADDAESQGMGGMMMGGGAMANRSYHKDDASVSISITSDSPMLQSVLMMFSNPSFMAMSGGKLVKVQGEKAILQKDLQLMLVLDNKVLITVDGSSGATEADVMAYANGIDLKKIRSL